MSRFRKLRLQARLFLIKLNDSVGSLASFRAAGEPINVNGLREMTSSSSSSSFFFSDFNALIVPNSIRLNKNIVSKMFGNSKAQRIKRNDWSDASFVMKLDFFFFFHRARSNDVRGRIERLELAFGHLARYTSRDYYRIFFFFVQVFLSSSFDFFLNEQ